MDNHYIFLVIHQDIQDQRLLNIMLNYFLRWNLHQFYQFYFDLAT